MCKIWTGCHLESAKESQGCQFLLGSVPVPLRAAAADTAGDSSFIHHKKLYLFVREDQLLINAKVY